MRNARRRLVLVLVVVGLLGAGAIAILFSPRGPRLPAPSEAFCDAAISYDAEVSTRPSPAEQIDLVRAMADAAPEDVADDAQTFLDALERQQAGDTSVVDDPRIQAAVNRVNRRAAQGCGFFERKPGNL